LGGAGVGGGGGASTTGAGGGLEHAASSAATLVAEVVSNNLRRSMDVFMLSPEWIDALTKVVHLEDALCHKANGHAVFNRVQK
jgi:hypothetical protein